MKPIVLDRRAADAVQSALNDAGLAGECARVLATEVIALRECIERCKSVQRIAAAAASVLEDVVRDDCVDAGIRYRASTGSDVYRELADKLAKALEGF